MSNYSSEEMLKRRADKTHCVFCNSTAVKMTDFVDKLSMKEFAISGMCQKCQDEFFNEESVDD
jgi:hypothetical protein